MKAVPINKVKELCYKAMTYTKGYEDFDNWWSKIYNDLIRDKTNNSFAKEFWEAYPNDFYSNGKIFPLRLMDYEQFVEDYNTNAIGNCDNKYAHEEHSQLMLDIEYAKANSLINYNIEKFMRSRAWEGIRKLRLMDNNNISTVTNEEKDFE